MEKLFVYCLCSLLTLSAGAAVKRVGSGDDLRRAIRTLAEGDTLLLVAGRYVVEGTLPLNRSMVISGEAGTRPEVVLPSFVAGAGARHLVLKNLAVTLSGRTLVGTSSEGEVDIDLIALDGCSVNLGGEQGGGVVNSRSVNAAKNRIGEIRVTDCVVFNGGYPSHFVFSAGSTSQTAVEKITLSNSTFADMARGIAVSNAAMQIAVCVDGCTFYNINRSDNVAGVIRLGNARADIGVVSSVFHFAGPKSRFIVAGPGSKVSVTDSYRAGGPDPLPGAHGVKTLAAGVAELFENASDDPLSAGASFGIREKTLSGLRIGDPRWTK